METRLDRIEKCIEEMFIGIAELKESQKKTDEQLRKTDELQRKTEVKLDRLGILFGNLGIVQGEVAEDLFYRNVGNLFKPVDLRFKRIRRNLKDKG
jgi:ribosome assembly protein YihI (activator of Der GTPase)